MSFTRGFWGQAEPLKSDLRQYSMFVETKKLGETHQVREIATKLSISRSTVYSWLVGGKMPNLGYFLKAHLELGDPPPGKSWLTVNSSHGHALPLGPWISVPHEISRWTDFLEVINQLRLLNQPAFERVYHAGFFLGMIIGDAAKSKQGNAHRHVGLVLSKKYGTNLGIGNFTCECAETLGLRMHRISDLPNSWNKPYGFYQWVSQSSLLLDWIFNVGLGLRDDQTTTYDPIDVQWMFGAPARFRTGVIQGLAESDGSVNIASQTVEFWIGPSWNLVSGLLKTFGLRSFQTRGALVLSKNQAVRSFSVPIFSPHLRTVRYQLHVKMASGRHVERGRRLPNNIREAIRQMSSDNLSTPRICERVLDEYGIHISYEAAQRWSGRLG